MLTALCVTLVVWAIGDVILDHFEHSTCPPERITWAITKRPELVYHGRWN